MQTHTQMGESYFILLSLVWAKKVATARFGTCEQEKHTEKQKHLDSRMTKAMLDATIIARMLAQFHHNSARTVVCPFGFRMDAASLAKTLLMLIPAEQVTPVSRST